MAITARNRAQHLAVRSVQEEFGMTQREVYREANDLGSVVRPTYRAAYRAVRMAQAQMGVR